MKFRVLWKPPAAAAPELGVGPPDVERLREPPRSPVRFGLWLLLGVGGAIAAICTVLLPNPVAAVRDYRLERDYRSHPATALTLRADISDIWLGTDGGGVERYDHSRQRFLTPITKTTTNDLLHSDRILDVALGRDIGAVLSAADPRVGGALQAVETSFQGLELWERPLYGPLRFAGLSDRNATAYAESKGRFAAVGTRDKGLGIYDWSTRSWTGFAAAASGLPSAGVTDLVWAAPPEGKESVLWAGTEKGLAGIAVDAEGALAARWWITPAEGLPGTGIRTLHLGSGFVWYCTEMGGVGRIKLQSNGGPAGDEAHEILITANPAATLSDLAFQRAAAPDQPGITWFTASDGARTSIGRYRESPRDLRAVALPAFRTDELHRLRVDAASGGIALVAAGRQVLFGLENEPEPTSGATPAGVKRLPARNRLGEIRSGVAGAFAEPVAEVAAGRGWAMARVAGSMHRAEIKPKEAAWEWSALAGAKRFPELTDVNGVVSSVQAGEKVYLAAGKAGLGVWDRKALELSRFETAPELADATEEERGVLDLALDGKGRLVVVGAGRGVRALEGDTWRTLTAGRGAALPIERIEYIAASGRWLVCGGGERISLFDGRTLVWRELPELSGIARLEMAGDAVWAQDKEGGLHCLPDAAAGGGWRQIARTARDWSVVGERVVVLESIGDDTVKLGLYAGASGNPLRAFAPGRSPVPADELHLAAITGRGGEEELVWVSDRSGRLANYDLRRRSWREISGVAWQPPFRALLGGESTLWVLDSGGQLHACRADGTTRADLAKRVARVHAGPDGSVLAAREPDEGPLLIQLFENDDQQKTLIGHPFTGRLDRLSAAAIAGGLAVAEGNRLGFYDWSASGFRNFEVAGKRIDALHAVGEQLWLIVDERLLSWDTKTGEAQPVMDGGAQLAEIRSITSNDGMLFALAAKGGVYRISKASPKAAKLLLKPSALPGYRGKLPAEAYAFAGEEIFASTNEGVFSFHAERGLQEGWQRIGGLARRGSHRLWASPTLKHLALTDGQSVAVLEAGRTDATERFSVQARGDRVADVAVDATDVYLRVATEKQGAEVWTFSLSGGAPQPLIGAAATSRAATAQVVVDHADDWLRLGADGVVTRYRRETGSWLRETELPRDARLLSAGKVVAAYVPGAESIRMREAGPGAMPGWREIRLPAGIATAAPAGQAIALWLKDGSLSWVGPDAKSGLAIPPNRNRDFPAALGPPVYAVKSNDIVFVEDQAGRLAGFDWSEQRWVPPAFERGILLGATEDLGVVGRKEDAGRSELWHRAHGGRVWERLARQPAAPGQSWVKDGSLWHAHQGQLEFHANGRWHPLWGKAPVAGTGLREAAVTSLSAAAGELLIALTKGGQRSLLAVDPRGTSRAVALPQEVSLLAPVAKGGFAAVAGDGNRAAAVAWGHVDGRGWREAGKAPVGTRSVIYDGTNVWAWDGTWMRHRQKGDWRVILGAPALQPPGGAEPRFVAAGESLWALAGDAVFRYRQEKEIGGWTSVLLPAGNPAGRYLWFWNDEMWVMPREGVRYAQRLVPGGTRFESVMSLALPGSLAAVPAPTKIATLKHADASVEVEVADGAAFLRGVELRSDAEPGAILLRSTTSGPPVRFAVLWSPGETATLRIAPAPAAPQKTPPSQTLPPDAADAALAAKLAALARVEARAVIVTKGVAWTLEPGTRRLLTLSPAGTAVPLALHRMASGERRLQDVCEANGEIVALDGGGQVWRYNLEGGFTAINAPFTVSSLLPTAEGLMLFPASSSGSGPWLVARDGQNLVESSAPLAGGTPGWTSRSRGREEIWKLPGVPGQAFTRAGESWRFDFSEGRFARDSFDRIELAGDRLVLRGGERSLTMKWNEAGLLEPAPASTGSSDAPVPDAVKEAGFRVERAANGPWSAGGRGAAWRIVAMRDGGFELFPSSKGAGLAWEFPESIVLGENGDFRVECESGSYTLAAVGRPGAVSIRAPAGGAAAAVARLPMDPGDWRISPGLRGLERRDRTQWVKLEWDDKGFLHQQASALTVADDGLTTWTRSGTLRHGFNSLAPVAFPLEKPLPAAAVLRGYLLEKEGTRALVDGDARPGAASGWRWEGEAWRPADPAWLVARVPALDPRLAGGDERLRWWKSSTPGSERVVLDQAAASPAETRYLPAAGRFESDVCLSLGVAGGQPWLLTPAGPRVAGAPLAASSTQMTPGLFSEFEFTPAFGPTDAALRDRSGAIRFEWRDNRWQAPTSPSAQRFRSRGPTWAIESEGGISRRIAGQEDVVVSMDEAGVWRFLQATALGAGDGADLVVGAGSRVLKFGGGGESLTALREVAAGQKIVAFEKSASGAKLDALTENGNRWRDEGRSWMLDNRGWDRRLPSRQQENAQFKTSAGGADEPAIAFRPSPSEPFQPLALRGHRLDFDDVTGELPLDAASFVTVARGRAALRSWPGGSIMFDASHRESHVYFQRPESDGRWRGFRAEGGQGVETWEKQWTKLGADAADDALRRRDSNVDAGALWRVARAPDGGIRFRRAMPGGSQPAVEVSLQNDGRFDFDAWTSVLALQEDVAIGTQHGLEVMALREQAPTTDKIAGAWYPFEVFGGGANEEIQRVLMETSGSLLVQSPKTVRRFALDRPAYVTAPPPAWAEAMAWRVREEAGWMVRVPPGSPVAGAEVTWRKQPTFLTKGPRNTGQLAHALAYSAQKTTAGILLGTRAGLTEATLNDAGEIDDVVLRSAPFRQFWPEAAIAWLETGKDNSTLAGVAAPKSPPVWIKLPPGPAEPAVLSADEAGAAIMPRAQDDLLQFVRQPGGALLVAYPPGFATPTTARPFVKAGTFAFLDLPAGLNPGNSETLLSEPAGFLWATAAGIMRFDPVAQRFTGLFAGPDESAPDLFLQPLRLWRSVHPAGVVAETENRALLFDGKTRAWSPSDPANPPDALLASLSSLLEWRVTAGGVRPALRKTDGSGLPVFRDGLADIDRIHDFAVGEEAHALTAGGVARHTVDRFALEALSAAVFQRRGGPTSPIPAPARMGLWTPAGGKPEPAVDLGNARLFVSDRGSWRELGPVDLERGEVSRALETMVETPRWRWSRTEKGLGVEIVPPFVNGPAVAMGAAPKSVAGIFSRGTFAWADPIGVNWSSTRELLVATPVGVARLEVDRRNRRAGLTGVDFWAAISERETVTVGPVASLKTHPNGEVWLASGAEQYVLDPKIARRWNVRKSVLPFTREGAAFEALGRRWIATVDQSQRRIRWQRQGGGFDRSWEASLAEGGAQTLGLTHVGSTEAGVWYLANGEFFLISDQVASKQLPFSW